LGHTVRAHSSIFYALTLIPVTTSSSTRITLRLRTSTTILTRIITTRITNTIHTTQTRTTIRIRTTRTAFSRTTLTKTITRRRIILHTKIIIDNSPPPPEIPGTILWEADDTIEPPASALFGAYYTSPNNSQIYSIHTTHSTRIPRYIPLPPTNKASPYRISPKPPSLRWIDKAYRVQLFRKQRGCGR
jgi:hypothetical protein